jgi:hypothetical protein
VAATAGAERSSDKAMTLNIPKTFFMKHLSIDVKNPPRLFTESLKKTLGLNQLGKAAGNPMAEFFPRCMCFSSFWKLFTNHDARESGTGMAARHVNDLGMSLKSSP